MDWQHWVISGCAVVIVICLIVVIFALGVIHGLKQ